MSCKVEEIISFMLEGQGCTMKAVALLLQQNPVLADTGCALEKLAEQNAKMAEIYRRRHDH